MISFFAIMFSVAVMMYVPTDIRKYHQSLILFFVVIILFRVILIFVLIVAIPTVPLSHTLAIVAISRHVFTSLLRKERDRFRTRVTIAEGLR